jgi:hypothetical protein
MPIPTKPSYDHGSSGTEPANPIDYSSGDPLNADNLDYYLNTEFSKLDEIITALEEIKNGTIQVASAANADSADAYKNNDIDSDGDGRVNAADTAQNVKGNDIDSDGDGVVDRADVADDGNASSYKNNDIDSDGDGTVDQADYADDADASSYKNNDIDSDGDGTVNNADQLQGQTPSAFQNAALRNVDETTNFDGSSGESISHNSTRVNNGSIELDTVDASNVSRDADDSDTSSGTVESGYGIVINPNVQLESITVTLSSNCVLGSGRLYLEDSAGNELASQNNPGFGGDTITFNVQLSAGTDYRILADEQQSDQTIGFDSDPSFGYTTADIDIVAGFENDSRTSGTAAAVSEVDGTKRASSGNAVVSWPTTYVAQFERAQFWENPDGESVTINVEDTNGNPLITDISKNQNLEALGVSEIQFDIVLSRNDVSNSPSVDYLGQSYRR